MLDDALRLRSLAFLNQPAKLCRAGGILFQLALPEGKVLSQGSRKTPHLAQLALGFLEGRCGHGDDRAAAVAPSAQAQDAFDFRQRKA